ncbi:LptA/OstA family protein [Caulobacter sp. KR2-114]|uniref:LptA/OstA family protein n=1 Tax=Caulobacter sp. KR2-114 TaxID=3400912 RepID=UPI003C02C612
MTDRTALGPRLAMVAILSLAAAGPALAQLDSRSTAPIDTTANEMEVVNSKCLVIFRGAAEALQGKSRLRANTISVYSHTKSVQANGAPVCGGTDRIEADGNVYFVTTDQNARGDHAVYSNASDQVVMTGNVIVVQGNNVARGDKLTYNLSTKAARLESGAANVGSARRVRGVFYPEPKDQNGATGSTPAPAPPATPAPGQS